MEKLPLTLVGTGLQSQHGSGTPINVMRGHGLHPQLTFDVTVQYSSLTSTTGFPPPRIRLLGPKPGCISTAQIKEAAICSALWAAFIVSSALGWAKFRDSPVRCSC